MASAGAGIQVDYPRHRSSYEIQARRPKSAYTQIVDAVIPVATFAGGITLATQLIIQCPNTRLQALLATSSQLFLNIPLVLIKIHIVLYGKEDSDQVEEFKEYRPFIIAQFIVAGIETTIGFILLSVAIYVADTSHHTVGIWGICLTAISVIIATLTTMYPLRFCSRSMIWEMAPAEIEAAAMKQDLHHEDRHDRSYLPGRRIVTPRLSRLEEDSIDSRHDRSHRRRREMLDLKLYVMRTRRKETTMFGTTATIIAGEGPLN